MKTTTWTISTWANRASAQYVPANNHIDNVTIDAYGRKVGTYHYQEATPRRAYKSEVSGGTAYVMYDDDSNGAVPIIRVVEA